MRNDALNAGDIPERAAERGFTLIELLIAMIVMVEVMAAILLLFTSLSDIARVQTDVAEMQQTQRVGQRTLIEVLRETGLGGLPIDDGSGLPPAKDFTGAALTIRGDAQPGDQIGDAGSDFVLPGSDVLILRGVFDTPVYYVTPQIQTRIANNDGLSLLDGAAEPFSLSGETLRIPRFFNTFDNFNQDIETLEDALGADPVRALIVRDLLSPGAYALVETNGLAADIAACGGDCIVVNITLTTAANGSTYAALMGQNTGAYDVQVGGAGQTVRFPRNIGGVGLLQEFRYYIRPDPSFDPLTPDDDDLLLADGQRLPAMRLSRLEVRPGTDVAIGPPIDIADNVLDLQLAMGIDTSDDCPPACGAAALLARGQVLDDGTQNDEVFFNHPADAWGGLTGTATGKPEVHFLRVTSLVTAPRPELGHRATPLLFIEDEDRSQPVTIAGVTFDYNASLANYRRRIMTTVVELRNVR